MTWIGDTPLKGIGMTDEKYALLCELANSNEYWATVQATVDTCAHVKLTSLSGDQRVRLALVILELDVALYAKSWGLEITGPIRSRERPATQATQATQADSSFSRMRNILKKRK